MGSGLAGRHRGRMSGSGGIGQKGQPPDQRRRELQKGTWRLGSVSSDRKVPRGLKWWRVGERPLGDELLQPSMWRRGRAESCVRSCGCDNIATN